MLIFHTADWHLGRALYGRRRYREQQAFLDWLADCMIERRADVLVVAGDVFDTGTPSNRAQELYFRFLARLASADCCRHVVVVAGNHDSPSFLDAPAHLLRALNVHVVGTVREHIADEVLLLRNRAGEAELIVCAVPYLRERDVRLNEAGESQQDKNRKLVEATAEHYRQVFQAACVVKSSLKNSAAVPVIATGHLFCTGSSSRLPEEGEGVRELYVGTLNRFPAAEFPAFDYIALGHLHVAQTLAATQPVRYSGSPLAVGFGEAAQQKSITTVSFADGSTRADIGSIPVPVFQRLERLEGDLPQLSAALAALAGEQPESTWLEIGYTGSEIVADLRAQLDTLLAGSPHEILCLKNLGQRRRLLEQQHEGEELADLDVYQVFERCLDAHRIPDSQRPDLQTCYRRAVQQLWEQPDGAADASA